MEDKSFLSQVKGFTPVIDILAEELGTMTALVYGIVWRYCQMEDKVCRASKKTISDHANISPKTVQRHLQSLVKAGYLEDTTPNRKHKPHVYKDAGKVQINGLVEAKLTGGTESPTSQGGGSESPTRGDTESQLGRTESPVKRVLDDTLEDRKETPSDFGIGQADPLDGVPQATDGHQRAVDEANGGNGIDPVEEVTNHHYWGYMGSQDVNLPSKERERTIWEKTGERLLNFIPEPWDIQTVLMRIDQWWADPELSGFWKENPCSDKALIVIARYVKNGGKPNAKDKRTNSGNSIRGDTLTEAQRQQLKASS